jgi:tRNA (mo5U34)-methyltransferase
MSELTPPDIQWFHSFELDQGERLNGIKALDILKVEADLILGNDLSGKTVLDIGAWDGFFSFEAERRGALKTVATDHFCWSGEGWGTRAGFDYVHARLNSKVEAVDADVYALPDRGLGQFDVVLFLGVFYHLKDPYVGLEKAAAMARDHLVMETVTALPREKLPAMRLFASGELGGDPTNFWAPNLPALDMMLRSFGFSRIEFMPSPVSEQHPIHASRLRPPSSKAVHRTIVHAWRS